MSVNFWDITRNGVPTGEVVEGTGGDAFNRARYLGGEYSFHPSEARKAAEAPESVPTPEGVDHGLADSPDVPGIVVELGGVAVVGDPETGALPVDLGPVEEEPAA